MTAVEFQTLEDEIMVRFNQLDPIHRKRILHKMVDAVIEPSSLPEKSSPEAITSFIGIFDDDVTDLSATVHETLEDVYRSKYADSD